MKVITIAKHSEGPVFGFGSVHFHAHSAGSFGAPEFVSRLTGLAAVYEATAAQYQEHLIVDHVREQTWAGVVRGGARDAFNAALSEARAAKAADLEHEEPARPVDPAFAADVWATYRATDDAGRARGIEAADLEELTALHQFGNRAPLAPALWDEATRRYRVENRLVKDSVAARHPAVATVDQPLAIGVDWAAARAQVEGWEKAHAERLEAVEADQATARHLLHFLAAVYEVSAGEVLDAILGDDA